MKAHTQTNVVLEVGRENVGRTFSFRVEKMQLCIHLLWELMPILCSGGGGGGAMVNVSSTLHHSGVITNLEVM